MRAKILMFNSTRFFASWFRLFGAFALALSLVGLSACSEPKPAFKAVDITGADYAKELNLPDQNGQVRKLKDFSGKLVVVFFGYTQCPDVCPTTMQELAEVKRLLGPDGDKLQAVFVTVDPERDTTELLKAYVDAGADMIFPEALRDEKEFEKIRKATKAYLLANMTEFGKSKLLSVKELNNLGYNLVIYPVTTQRLALKNVEDGLRQIFKDGHQNNVIDKMQTRKRLYELVDYEKYGEFDSSIFKFSKKGHE